MSRGSYRGGSTPVGWNANRYVAPSLTGRARSGKALIKDLTARTAQSRAEQQALDDHARKRHGLASAKSAGPVGTGAAASTGRSDVAGEARKRLKAGASRAFTVTVLKRKRPPRAAP